MDANRFNQILLIDSIPKGQYNTARRLFEDMDTYARAYAPTPAIQYVRVESADELMERIWRCQRDAEKNEVIPMLHIECHGNEDYFQLADGSLLAWAELKTPLTELNVATRMNLMISVAACTGGALMKVMRVGERAPFWGLIGPTRSITVVELETAYRSFYLTLLSTKSTGQAIQALKNAAAPGLFFLTTAQKLFERVWAQYRNACCPADAIEIRAQRMSKLLQAAGMLKSLTASELIAILEAYEPHAFKRYWQTFFMCDRFPEHLNRFPVEFVP